MAWSELEIACKKHPDHRQQPGVCSVCLREKLSQLSLSPDPSRMVRTLVAVSSAGNSNSDSSSSMSPVVHRHRRHASTGGSLGFIISSTGIRGGSLKKSRSITFITEHDGGKSKKGGGGGFWKKLIRSTGKGTKKVFLHSRTVKDQRSDDYDNHF